MTIETAYDIGDIVFRMKDNKVIEDTIYEISIRVRKSDTGHVIEEIYILNIGGGQPANNFFPTKEDLLKSL